MALIAYVSGHGFGHFTRSEAVLERVASRGIDVHLRTSERALSLARRAPWAASVTEVDTGPGVAQKGPLAIDLDATRTALTAHVARFGALADAEARALRALGARAVYADVPPVAFEAAARAGVPSVGLSNFSWSFIYEGYRASCPGLAALAPPLRSAEARAGLLLELPWGCGLEHFPRRRAIPLVVRAATRSREAARALLPIPTGERRPIVLLSFGGFDLSHDPGAQARKNPSLFFVSFGPPRTPAENLAVLAHDHGLPHQDLVLAADALIGKPGYGTVAEAVSARTPFVYTERGEFREYAYLAAAIERHLPFARLSPADFAEGRWTDAVTEALAAPCPPLDLGLDGADVAARAVASIVETGSLD